MDERDRQEAGEEGDRRMHQSIMKVCFQGYAVFWGGDPCKNVDCDTVTVKDVFLLLNLIPVCHHHVYAYSTTIGKIYIFILQPKSQST